jgi:hypothetical protein
MLLKPRFENQFIFKNLRGSTTTGEKRNVVTTAVVVAGARVAFFVALATDF